MSMNLLRAVIGQPRYDADVMAFAAASGATDLAKINDLVVYLKAQSLWASARIYPLKSAQNAGSGATAFGLGGLTSNNMSLLGSPAPSWGAGGITFNGTSQYGSINDFLGSETLTIFARNTISTTSPGAGTRGIVTQFDGLSDRSFSFGYAYDSSLGTRLFRSGDGTSANQEAYQNAANTLPGADRTAVAQWTAGGGRALWHDNASQSLSLFAGSAQTARFNESVPILINATDSATPGAFLPTTTHAVVFVTGTLTALQRETITDLINAL